MHCPECSGRMRHDARRAEWVCPHCGAVVEAPLADGAEGVPFGHGHARERGRRRGPTGRLRRAEDRAVGLSSSERRLLEARLSVERVADTLGCPPDVAERAGRLLERARKAGITSGRPFDALAGAALLASCRMLFLTRTEDAVAEAAGVGPEALRRAYRALVAGLRLSVPAMSAHQYMGQVASRLQVVPETESAAREILLPICGTQRAAGKNPLGWAAAALVLASRETRSPISIQKAARAAGVSPSTVKGRVDELTSPLD